MSGRPDMDDQELNAWLHGKPQQDWEDDEEYRLRVNVEEALERMLEWLEKHREALIRERPASEKMLRNMTREYAIRHRKNFIEMMSFWFDTHPGLAKKKNN